MSKEKQFMYPTRDFILNTLLNITQSFTNLKKNINLLIQWFHNLIDKLIYVEGTFSTLLDQVYTNIPHYSSYYDIGSLAVLLTKITDHCPVFGIIDKTVTSNI